MQSLCQKLIFCLVFVGLIFGFLFVFNPLPVQADDLLWKKANEGGLTEIGKTYGANNNPKDIRIIIAQGIRVFLGFLGIIFLMLLIIAGFKWMTAMGEEEKVREATKQIRNAIIGLLIVLASYGLAVFVINAVLLASK